MNFKNFLTIFFLNGSILNSFCQNTSEYYSIKTPLIPQKGNFSCWAATLQMLDSKNSSVVNKENTSPIRTDSLSKYLNFYKSEKYARISDPGWGKIKEHLASGKSLVTYKYFNEKFAHVFLVRGFQETKNTRWLIVNDPWPVNKAKITALAFNQFIRPFNGNQEYLAMSYSTSSKSSILKSESAFNIFSSVSLKEENPTFYLPPKVQVDKKKFKIIKEKDIETLVQLQVELLKSFDESLFSEMKIEYASQKQMFSKDMNSMLRLNQFTNTLSFLKYDLKASMKSDYLFDGLKLAFVNVNINRKPLINLTIEYENKSDPTYLYVSRFEKYGTSERAEWDKIDAEFNRALKNPEIAKILNGTSTKAVPNKGPNAFFELDEDDEFEIDDISMLPLYGGMVYSFTWPPFDEKIVADPFRQLGLKPRKEAIFISESGTPFYRLSAVSIPDWGEIISKEMFIGEEWQTDKVDFSNMGPDLTHTPTKTPPKTNVTVSTQIPTTASVTPKDTLRPGNPKNDPMVATSNPNNPRDDIKPQATNNPTNQQEMEDEKKKLEEQKRKEAEALKKAEAEKERQRKLDEEKKKAEAEKERQRKLEEEKKKAEAEKERQRKLDEEKKKAEAEKERLRKLEEEKKKAEAEKQKGTKG
jgi:hypothetical protein